MPDLTILLDLAPDVGLKRSLKIKNKEIRFENKDKIYHEKIRKNFLKLSKKYKNMYKIDASLSKNIIHKKIIDHLNKLLFFKRKLPGNLIMMYPTKIIGHNEQLKILNESYHVQFPHAWIFNGIKGIGEVFNCSKFHKISL